MTTYCGPVYAGLTSKSGSGVKSGKWRGLGTREVIAHAAKLMRQPARRTPLRFHHKLTRPAAY